MDHLIRSQQQLSAQTRDLIQRGMFVEPLPQVTRVVFICTPHRGSFVAGRTLIANIVRRLLNPQLFTGLTADFARNRDAARIGLAACYVIRASREASRS